jgi:uncharacterized protein DUF5670
MAGALIHLLLVIAVLVPIVNVLRPEPMHRR